MALDPDRPYVGWLDHYQAGWQGVLVYVREDGKRTALRLGREDKLEFTQYMCLMLSDQLGVQVAGELSKRGFLPVDRPL